MKSTLDIRGLLSRLAAADCQFVVIGSSALALQGWEISPDDLDLFADPEDVEGIVGALDVPGGQAAWVDEGEARRLECQTPGGPVDIYTRVSGGLGYETVASHSLNVSVGEGSISARVGSLEHVRDMRSAVGRDSLPQSAVPPVAKTGFPHIVAIDGPAGAGKSTVSKALARSLGFTYLNTGAMYRCVTLAVFERQADPDDLPAIAKIANEVRIEFLDEQVFLNDCDVSAAIRSDSVTLATPHIAAYPEVRQAMIGRQRELFATGRYVTEGRDIGTVVAPDAPLKVYLTASPEERAARRSLETGDDAARVLTALEDRDRLDSERKLSALKVADDAVVVDTTGRTVQDVVDEIGALARERGIA